MFYCVFYCVGELIPNVFYCVGELLMCFIVVCVSS